MKRLALGVIPAMAMLLLLIVALWLAADAESAQSELGKSYPWLLMTAAIAVIVLLFVVVREGWRLLRLRRSAEPGSKLNMRLALLIGTIAIPPIVLVAAFAIRFVDTGIDSWFRADVATAQGNAEFVGREVLASFERRARNLSRRFADAENLQQSGDAQADLDTLSAGSLEPVHLSLYDVDGNVMAISFNTSDVVFPGTPTAEERLQVREAGQLALNERSGTALVWRVLEPLGNGNLLQTVTPVPVDLAPHLEALERTAVDYSQLKYQRQAMKSTFVLILGLVSLLALLGALFAALAASRRLIQPLSDLVVAAGHIAEGRYGHALAAPSDDELGDLTESFNRMSHELASAHERERESRTEIESSRARLEAILKRLSAGVISFNRDCILTANQAAGALLEIDAGVLIGVSLEGAASTFPRARSLFTFLAECARAERSQWRDEVRLDGEPVRALLVRGTLLPSDGQINFVAVFDDAALIALTQREAAWAEVAKRLAHEIKNPLTPIQLAAERLRHKYLGKMTAAEADVLDRATQTIVSQVDALKRIVNAFGDYSKPVSGEKQWLDLKQLIEEICALYEHSGQCRIRREYSVENIDIRGNRERLRQALINIVTNAIEASNSASDIEIDVRVQNAAPGTINIFVRDHGPGLPDSFNARWFEPYNTTKTKGTGLGLAWVKRIAEEHGGGVSATNVDGGGAEFCITIQTGNH